MKPGDCKIVVSVKGFKSTKDNYMYETPSNWGDTALNRALGGWRIGGTMLYHTGFGMSPVDVTSRSELRNVTGLRTATPLATFAGGIPSSTQGKVAVTGDLARGGPTFHTQPD